MNDGDETLVKEFISPQKFSASPQITKSAENSTSKECTSILISKNFRANYSFHLIWRDSINNSQFDESIKNKVDMSAWINVEAKEEEQSGKKSFSLRLFLFSRINGGVWCC